jgi:hypothetical protein
MLTLNYTRLHRPRTDSWITFKLPKPLETTEMETFVKVAMPDWEIVSASQYNPDENYEAS